MSGYDRSDGYDGYKNALVDLRRAIELDARRLAKKGLGDENEWPVYVGPRVRTILGVKLNVTQSVTSVDPDSDDPKNVGSKPESDQKTTLWSPEVNQ